MERNPDNLVETAVTNLDADFEMESPETTEITGMSMSSRGNTVSMASPEVKRSALMEAMSTADEFSKFQEIIQASISFTFYLYDLNRGSAFGFQPSGLDAFAGNLLARFDKEALVYAWEIVLIESQTDAVKAVHLFNVGLAMCRKSENFRHLFEVRVLFHLQMIRDGGADCEPVFKQLKQVVLMTPQEDLPKLRKWIENPESGGHEEYDDSASTSANLSPMMDEVASNSGPVKLDVSQAAKNIDHKLQIAALVKALNAEKKRNDDLESKVESCRCTVCMTNPIKIVLNCYHSFCSICAEKIAKCPICRCNISKKSTLYY